MAPQVQTQPTHASPLILRRSDGRTSVALEAAHPESAPAPPPAKKVKPEGQTYTLVGYRQTIEPAVNGGKANSAGIRFRNGGLRAMSRTGRNDPFITGHDWGDARARGGTILDCWVEKVDQEMLVFFEVLATEDWAIRGFENGTIDRFSLGASFQGEITCTLHDCPIWSTPECCCMPGMETEDGKVVEFEVEDGIILELSAVNVPAVEGTYVVAAAGAGAATGSRTGNGQLPASGGGDVRIQAMQAFAHHCGRSHPSLRAGVTGGAQQGGSPAVPAGTTMSAHPDGPQPKGNTMDRAKLCGQLGLPVTATDEEIGQRIATLGSDAAQVAALRAQLEQSAADRETERARTHVESGIASLRASHQVTDKVIEGLRAAAAPPGGLDAFDRAIELVRNTAAPLASPGSTASAGAAPVVRATLQSDATPAPNPGNVSLEDGPDAFESTRANPNLPRFMRWGGVSEKDVREHGAKTFHVIPNLRDLADATDRRG